MMIVVSKIKFLRKRGATLLAAALVLLSGEVSAERIKDLASIGGVRENQLIGYGLVVGLQGTGDGKDVSFTGQSLKSILSSLGVTIIHTTTLIWRSQRGDPLSSTTLPP